MDSILRFYILPLVPLRNVTIKNPPTPNARLAFLMEQIDMCGFPNLDINVFFEKIKKQPNITEKLKMDPDLGNNRFNYDRHKNSQSLTFWGEIVGNFC